MLLVLLAAVLVPTGCVLWFMNAAMRNVRLAVRQRLTDVYRKGLQEAQGRLDEHWAEKVRALDAAGKLPGPEAFQRLVKAGEADSAVLYDESGKPAHPAAARALPATDEQAPPLWARAEQLEFELADHQAAADEYRQIAQAQQDVHVQAQALRAQARCLVRAGKTQAAIDLLAGTLAQPQFRDARDAHGRLIVPDAQWYALQLISPPGGERWRAVLDDLRARLARYDGPEMPSSQRLFLLRQLPVTGTAPGPLLAAEELAAEYLEAHSSRPAGTGLRPAGVEGLWTLTSSDGRTVGLFTDASVSVALESLDLTRASLASVSVVAHYGPAPPNGAEPFLAVPAGSYMPNWQIWLLLDGPDPFAAAAGRQNAAYVWTGAMGIAMIAILSLLVAGHVGRQIRLTRLKNDLIATVSHELKTPLASMRVLVDTLLADRYTDPRQVREYLQLIGRENERLSRLIDNFLTFSRMERNKKAFEFDRADAGEIIAAAVDSVREKYAQPGCRLEADVAADLPAVYCDRDAMITVLLNLLDNAWKYSGQPKHVRIRARRADGSVCVEVADNGIGMSRRTARRIFKRFYQADQRLSRQAGGCGLGLSIVKFILDAHSGSIDVTSRPGKGSTFTVKLPAAEAG